MYSTSAGTDIVDVVCDRGSVLEHLLLEFLGQHRGARLFKNFLVIALYGAITQPQYLGGAVAVTQDLDLYMTQGDDAFLDIDIAVAEGASGFG